MDAWKEKVILLESCLKLTLSCARHHQFYFRSLSVGTFQCRAETEPFLARSRLRHGLLLSSIPMTHLLPWAKLPALASCYLLLGKSQKLRPYDSNILTQCYCRHLYEPQRKSPAPIITRQADNCTILYRRCQARPVHSTRGQYLGFDRLLAWYNNTLFTTEVMRIVAVGGFPDGGDRVPETVSTCYRHLLSVLVYGCILVHHETKVMIWQRSCGTVQNEIHAWNSDHSVAWCSARTTTGSARHEEICHYYGYYCHQGSWVFKSRARLPKHAYL